MTLAEAQTVRTAILAAIESVASGGAIKSYGINGRSVQRSSLSDLLNDLANMDALIDRLQNGTFSVVQFRPGQW